MRSLMSILKAVSVSEFKAHCLQYLEETRTIHTELLVTKRGKPIAKIVPVTNEGMPFAYGDMQNSITLKSNILDPIDTEWDVA